MRRCPKVVFKSLVTPNPQSLIPNYFSNFSSFTNTIYSKLRATISNSREAFSVVKGSTSHGLSLNQTKKDAVTYVTASFFQGEHSISRVLSHLRGDDYLSSQPIARLLKRRNPEGQRATSTLPYSVLLRMGFTKPAGLPTAGALLPHLSTLTTCVAVSFSMALSLGSLPPDVIRHPALRSSDFPHALRPAIIFPARVLQYSMET